jgi:hypothetical protein
LLEVRAEHRLRLLVIETSFDVLGIAIFDF